MKTKGRNSQLHIAVLLLALVTVLAYLPVLRADYVNFDDELYVTLNPAVQYGLTAHGLVWAFDIGYEGNWTPLTWISHMLVRQVAGPGPVGPHAMNLLLHVANVLLLLLLLNRITKSLWRSALVAALFAVHPIHVESVAWVVERKDVLSTLFWMLTMWAYVRYTDLPNLKRYSAILLFFALGLMSKPTLVTLPLVFLLLDYWPLGRWSGSSAGERRRLLWEKLPLLVMSAASSVITVLAQQRGDAIRTVVELPLIARAANASIAYLSYVGKMLWPSKLAVFYPRSPDIPVWHAVAAVAILIILTVIAVRVARSRPYMVVGWLWYLAVMLPMIGLVQVGEHAMADRFAYVPFIGLYIVIVWGISDLLSRRVYLSSRLQVIPALFVIVLAGITWRQAGYWQDSVTLWTHAIAVTADNAVAHYSLGNAYKDSGKSEDAVDEYKRAIGIKPDYAKAHNNLGIVLFDLGRSAEAVVQYKAAIRIKPNYADAYYNLGIAYRELGKLADALAAYVQATRFKPNDADSHYNLGSTYSELGRFADALGEFEKALRIDSENADAYFGLGNALGRMGRYADAADAYKQATRINPDYADAHYNLGDACARLGSYADAAEAYGQVIRINPGDAEAHFLLGVVYVTIGEKGLAQREYETLRSLSPPLAGKLLALMSKQGP